MIGKSKSSPRSPRDSELQRRLTQSAVVRLPESETTGGPVGSNDFVFEFERVTPRRLRGQKPGAEPSSRDSGQQLDLLGGLEEGIE